MYSDSDIVIYKNPIPYINQLNFDTMIFQKDATICTGFFFILACEKALELLDYALNDLKMTKKGDQKSMISSYYHFGLTPDLLPQHLFCSGAVFFSKYQYAWDLSFSDIYTMHNNYIRGKECKRLRMLELGYTKTSYDANSTKYLTANALPLQSDELQKQLSLLVDLANQFHRVLIIPPIPCSIGKGYCTIANREHNGCFYDLLSQLQFGHRESSFIGKLKSSLTNQTFISFDRECNLNYGELVVPFPPRNEINHTVLCVKCLKPIQECVVDYFHNRNGEKLISLILH